MVPQKEYRKMLKKIDKLVEDLECEKYKLKIL